MRRHLCCFLLLVFAANLSLAADGANPPQVSLAVLYGTEGWGAANSSHRSYRPATNKVGWTRFRVRVGRAYQGRFRYLVFMNDHDVDQPTADSRFRNVAIYESGALSGNQIRSRDGIRWHRTAGRERIIPNGPEGAWDSGIIFTASQPVVLDDRILIVYSAFQGDHHGHPLRDWKESKKYYRGGIGVATLRRDGWVSLNLPFTGGHVITKPITIPKATSDDDTPRLILNTNAFTGDVKVTLLDEANQPIAGFQQSHNLHGDFLRIEVTWPNGHTLAELVGRKVKLKLHGRLAKLYSFWFE